jgi:hypothetical protein
LIRRAICRSSEDGNTQCATVALHFESDRHLDHRHGSN